MSELNPNSITTTAPISLTDTAALELKKIRAEQNISDDKCLRVGVKGGGCSGFSYILGFDTKKEGDQEFTVKGINLLMNKAHGLYLAGLEIDYLDSLDARGFMFNNPNASESCGCGSSFSA